MKKCTITFKIGDTELSITVSEDELYGVEGERSLPTGEFLARLATILYNHKDLWNGIKNNIILYLKNNSAVSQLVSFNSISKKDGLVPNVNFKYIQESYPDIEFPDIDVPILLLDNLDVQSRFAVSGRVLDKKGKEIFVVRGDKDSLVKLKNYLIVREKVKKKDYKIDDELTDALNKIASDLLLSPEEVILLYLNNNKLFRADYKKIIDGASYYTWMTYIVSAIRGSNKSRKFKNPILNELSNRLITNKYEQKTITISELHSILQQNFPHIFTTLKAFVEIFNKRAGEVIEYVSLIKNLNDSEKELLAALIDERSRYIDRHPNDETDLWGMTTLFNVINSLLEPNENPLSIRPVTINNKKLIFEDKFPSLLSSYGYGYETVASFTEEEQRNGYHIYSQTKEMKDKTITYYYVTKYFINEQLNALRFSSLEEAQEWIDNHYNTQNIRKNSFIDLKRVVTLGEKRTFESNTFIPEGTIFNSIDMLIDLRSMYNEEYLLIDKTLLDFFDYIETLDISQDVKTEILSKINTPEKALLFLSEINKLLNIKEEDGTITYPRNDGSKIKAIINLISTYEPSYYYVSSSFKVDDNKYRIHFIKTDITSTTSKRHNKRTPVILLLNKIAEVMETKFGVPVHIVNEEELAKMDEDINITKAFIKDGEIYINSAIARVDDAFHEYAHLFLGALKANPEYRDNYFAFVNKVLSTKEGLKKLRANLRKFSNRSYMDIAEETVADLYGEFMEGNLPFEISSLFAINEDIKKILDTIFDKKDKSKGIRDFDGGIIKIWKTFNSEVAKALNDNITFINDKSLLVLRQKDNWIKDKIKSGEIEENCE